MYTEKRKIWILEDNTFAYKTITVTKAFTTEPKRRRTTINIARKGSIVKEKCRQLTEDALNLFPDRHIPDEDLTYLVQLECGADKETVRAYKGYLGTVKRTRSGEGYVSGQSRKGYLELFGYMHRISRVEWVIHAQMRLENADSGNQCNERLEVSKEEISISPILQGKECEKTVLEVVSPTSREAEEILLLDNNNNNNIPRKREILLHRSLDKQELTPEVLRILEATPVDSEPDRSKPIRSGS